jgi:hypothetical protein
MQDWYEIEYPQLCLNTHGSGLVGLRGATTDRFHGFAGQAFLLATLASLAGAALVLDANGMDPSSSDEIATAFSLIREARRSDGPS